MAYKVLVCDNEDVLRALVRASLDGSGYEIVEARDGDEALALARGERPDLILLDVSMPRCNGLAVLEAVRAEPELAGTRVVMLTAHSRAADREAIVRAGADRFLTKPFSPLEIAAVVAELLPAA